jgi:hypothetical protein
MNSIVNYVRENTKTAIFVAVVAGYFITELFLGIASK